ncbi:MAG TPA: hypothetical protein VFV50_15700 [Bdellovibrionales bacterium]|nr:hypothetical protein [Bdellovibrionales bacterium]
MPEWFAVETTTAFSKPSSSAKPSFVVRQDQPYGVLAKTKDGWLRIRDPRSKRAGYVPVAALRPRRARERLTGKGEAATKEAGLVLGYSYVTQPSRTFKDANPNVEISTLTSTTLLIGAYYQFAMNAKWTGRGSLHLRKLDLNGTSRVVSGSVNTAPTALQVTQDFFGVAAVLQYALSPRWWVGAGFEVDQATKTSVTTTNQADQPEKPLYVLVQALTGFEFQMGSFGITPELRAGVIPNSTPMMINAELATMLGYRF